LIVGGLQKRAQEKVGFGSPRNRKKRAGVNIEARGRRERNLHQVRKNRLTVKTPGGSDRSIRHFLTKGVIKNRPPNGMGSLRQKNWGKGGKVGNHKITGTYLISKGAHIQGGDRKERKIKLKKKSKVKVESNSGCGVDKEKSGRLKNCSKRWGGEKKFKKKGLVEKKGRHQTEWPRPTVRSGCVGSRSEKSRHNDEVSGKILNLEKEKSTRKRDVRQHCLSRPKRTLSKNLLRGGRENGGNGNMPKGTRVAFVVDNNRGPFIGHFITKRQ